jgi:hypothetical protein
MTRSNVVRDKVLALLPPLTGWKVYKDGIATGKAPPWVVVSFTEKSRTQTEYGGTDAHFGVLQIRVVGAAETGVNTVCDLLSDALDNAKPESRGIGRLVVMSDSGAYPSDLINDSTSLPYVMRVLTWRLGWNNQP